MAVIHCIITYINIYLKWYTGKNVNIKLEICKKSLNSLDIQFMCWQLKFISGIASIIN